MLLIKKELDLKTVCTNKLIVVLIFIAVGISTAHASVNKKLESVQNESLSSESLVPIKVRSITEHGNKVDQILYAEKKDGLYLYEGDIILGTYSPKEKDMSIKGIVHSDPSKRWTDGKVPYAFHANFSQAQINLILRAMNELEEIADIDFVPRVLDENFISIRDYDNCSSAVGMTGRVQYLSLGSGCFSLGTIKHELLHALGFWHEQSRSDRDLHIDIHEDNIQPNMLSNFKKVTEEGTNLGDYDFNSIMHYSRTTFSIDGSSPTITRKDDYYAELGGEELTATDRSTLMQMYNQSENLTYDYIQSLDFIPASSNEEQQGFIRFSNISASVVDVIIDGIDDSGNYSANSIEFQLQPYETKPLSSDDLEYGNDQKGITGAFGNGVGNWRIDVFSSHPILLGAYMRTQNGFLTQMDALVPTVHGLSHVVPMFNPASNTDKVSKIRLINISNETNTFTISGIDDSGQQSNGTVTIDIQGLSSQTFTAQDLEFGREDKGIEGKLGDGAGKWILDITSTKKSRLMSFMETDGGYLTNLSSFGNKGRVSTNLFCSDLDGARIYSNERHPVYLGFFGSSEAIESVTNPNGAYGNSSYRDNLFDRFSDYGSSFSDLSHNNSTAKFPPIIINSGKAIAYITTNSQIDGGYSLDAIFASCSFDKSSAEPAFDVSFIVN